MFDASTFSASRLLHIALAAVIALEGAINLAHGLSAPRDPELIAFGAAEVIGTLLLIWPRSARAGACVLVCAFVVAAIVHLVAGEFPSEHLVYVLAVLFVITHRPRSSASPDKAAA